MQGAYGMTTLYGVFPPLMFWHLVNPASASGQSPKHIKPNTSSEPSIWRRPLGNMALAGMGACACAVMMGQVSIVMNASNVKHDLSLKVRYSYHVFSVACGRRPWMLHCLIPIQPQKWFWLRDLLWKDRITCSLPTFQLMHHSYRWLLRHLIDPTRFTTFILTMYHSVRC